MTATEAINAAQEATTVEELDALLVDESRVTVLSAIEMRRAALTVDTLDATPDATPDATLEDDGLVEVTTTGDVGTHKNLSINGVASVVACGIVMRVTPEVAEQLRQCSLI